MPGWSPYDMCQWAILIIYFNNVIDLRKKMHLLSTKIQLNFIIFLLLNFESWAEKENIIIIPVNSNKRSAKVLFPWSTCAIMQKFLILSPRNSDNESLFVFYKRNENHTIIVIHKLTYKKQINSWQKFSPGNNIFLEKD